MLHLQLASGKKNILGKSLYINPTRVITDLLSKKKKKKTFLEREKRKSPTDF